MCAVRKGHEFVSVQPSHFLVINVRSQVPLVKVRWYFAPEGGLEREGQYEWLQHLDALMRVLTCWVTAVARDGSVCEPLGTQPSHQHVCCHCRERERRECVKEMEGKQITASEKRIEQSSKDEKRKKEQKETKNVTRWRKENTDQDLNIPGNCCEKQSQEVGEVTKLRRLPARLKSISKEKKKKRDTRRLRQNSQK